MEDLFDRWWPGPMWLRPATGGLLLGGLLIALPEMYGVGYPVLEAGIKGHYHGGFLMLLLAGKLLAPDLNVAPGQRTQPRIWPRLQAARLLPTHPHNPGVSTQLGGIALVHHEGVGT